MASTSGKKSGRGIRNHATNNSLWDDDGVEWQRPHEWLTHAEIEQELLRADQTDVNRIGVKPRWLSSAEARKYWDRAKTHAQDFDAKGGVQPDEEGLTYTGTVWRQGGETLLGFHEH
jgi:hypothetical protein